jgi:hypothetical protein
MDRGISSKVFEESKEKTNEHLDDFICGSAGSLDWRIHYVPRSRRADPLATCIRGDLSDIAFFARDTVCLNPTRRNRTLSFGRDDNSDDSFIHRIHERSCLL